MLKPNQINSLVINKSSYLNYYYELIDIFENNLLPYIDKDMKAQFSEQTYHYARFRTVPINILPKIIDKLTNIYSTPVIRTVVDGSPRDKELMDWYAKEMGINVVMNSANELFNLCKTTLIQPYIDAGKPYLRPILNNNFVVYSENKNNPTIPTHVILLCGEKDGKSIYHTWSDTEFLISNSAGEIEYSLMAQYGELLQDGINPIGKIPFIYINQSKYRLCPKKDEDILKLTKLMPVQFTDLNVAAMFQSFSIMYGIDVNDENTVFAPNAFWRLKSDLTSDKKPEIGTIKPQVDYQEVINLIQTQLTIWMQTKGIRASSVGSLTPDNFSSGISKLIDEMDTFEARQDQTHYFEQAEYELWDLILKRLHPYWVITGQIDNKAMFDLNAFVQTTFAVQLPRQSRSEAIKDAKEEYASGFTTKKRAIKSLNPEMSDDQVNELLEEINVERGIIQIEEIQVNNLEENENAS